MSSSTAKPPPVPTCSQCGGTLRSAFVGRICPRCLLTGTGVAAAGPEASANLEPVSSDPAAMLQEPGVGRRIGDYEILHLLGRGGMAVVYLARQIGLDRLVALKTMSTPMAADAQAQERFRREARAVAQLDHPGIVSIHDAGVLDGTLFYTMDYVDGSDLGRVLRERPIPPREAAALMRAVADAVGYAHSRGIVHRDLKPANILLDASGRPRVADFGLAIEARRAHGALTATGDVLGTPPYMAPEILAGGTARATAPADVYALGATLFHLLTGRTPFIGEMPSEILCLALDELPPSPRLLNPNVPRDLETICLKCLEKEPAARYPDAGALGQDLERFLQGEPIVARPVSGPLRLLRWSRRRPALAAVWCLVAALAIGATVANVRIRAEQLRAEFALRQTRAAEAAAKERLRGARLSEAQALRRTSLPGRRRRALAALAEAAKIRPGADLRDEAVAALMLYDATPLDQWKLDLRGPGEISLDPTGTVAAVEMIADPVGVVREPAVVRKWGSRDGVTTLSGPGTQAVGPLRFSADGQRFVESFTDDTLRVWRTGESAPCLTLPLAVRPGEGGRTQSCNDHYAFTPDGDFLLLGRTGRGLALHRLADGGEVARWEEGDVFDCIKVSPDGRYAAAESLEESRPRSVFVVSLPDLKLVRTFNPAGAAGLLSWSGDSRVVTIGQNDGRFEGYDVRDGALASAFTDTVHRSKGVCSLGRDGLLAVVAATSLHMVNTASGREELFFGGVGRFNPCVAPGGEVLTMPSADGTVTRMTIDLPVGFQSVLPSRAAGYEVIGNAFSMDFSPDGRWIASVDRGYLLLFDARSGRLMCDLETPLPGFDDFGSVAFSADGRSLYRCSSTLTLTKHAVRERPGGGWEIGPGEDLGAGAGFFIADQSADRQRLALLNFKTGAVRVVSVAGVGMRTLSEWVTPGIYNAAFSPDGEQIVTNSDGMGPQHASQRIRVHRVRDGTVVRELGSPVSCDVAWSRDGHTAMTSNGPSESVLWNTSDWTVRATLKGELGGNVTTYAISPDGSYAAITHDDRVHLVSTRDGSLLASFACPGATGLAASVRFQPDGERFAVLWRDGRIDLINPKALAYELDKMGLGWGAGP